MYTITNLDLDVNDVQWICIAYTRLCVHQTYLYIMSWVRLYEICPWPRDYKELSDFLSFHLNCYSLLPLLFSQIINRNFEFVLFVTWKTGEVQLILWSPGIMPPHITSKDVKVLQNNWTCILFVHSFYLTHQNIGFNTVNVLYLLLLTFTMLLTRVPLENQFVCLFSCLTFIYWCVK